MKVLNFVENGINGKREKVEISSLKEGLELKPFGIFLIETGIGVGYLFYPKSEGCLGCDFVENNNVSFTKEDPQEIFDIFFKKEIK